MRRRRWKQLNPRDIWLKRLLAIVLALALLMIFAAKPAWAGGPHWVAGAGYFNSSVKGQPLIQSGGEILVSFDQGPLSPTVTNAQAVALVASARQWSAVPTAAIGITSGSGLAEDVNGTNVTVSSGGVVTMPADIRPTATNRPVAVVFDADGSVINALYGPGASSPTACENNGVITYVDNFSTAGIIAHAVMIVNGLCATSSSQMAILQYQIMRGFGRLFGLDWSYTNEEMFVNDQLTTEGMQGWPIMHPVEKLCNGSGNACTTNPTTLRPDDIAAISRLYPVTVANLANYPGLGKKITSSMTFSVTGTIQFKNGQGMQGVNVVLRPLVNGVPDIRYTVTAVSGVYFQGNTGNRINGVTDAQGNPLNRFGSDDPALEGYFNLSAVALPPGLTVSDYQLTFEPINPEYVQEFSVGPYVTGQVMPSGTMPVITLHGLTAGASVTENIVIEDSANNPADTSRGSSDGTEATPAEVPAGGEWAGRLDPWGQTAWFEWRPRANRQFTLEDVSLDEKGQATEDKAQPLLGLWNGTDADGTLPVTGTLQPFNGDMVGLTKLLVSTTVAAEVRLGIEDERGDGRPDYLYRGRVLYADTVSPARLPVSGGPIAIKGMGFRLNSTVTVNGNPAPVTSVSPLEITAIAPPSGGVTGNVLVQVQDPQTLGIAVIEDGLSYNAENGDLLAVVAAPSGNLSMGVPVPFTVRALDETGQLPAPGATVTFNVTEGAAVLGCGAPSCTVVTDSDGTAAISVTPSSTSLTQITAMLTNGVSVLAEFSGIAPPSINAVTPNLWLAIGASAQWDVQGLVLNDGAPLSGQPVTWTPMGEGVTALTPGSMSNSSGVVVSQLSAGPLGSGDVVPVNACLAGTGICTQFTVVAVHTQTAALVPVSGISQLVPYTQSLAPVVLRVTDAIGHPMAGGIVTFYETLTAWATPCPKHGRCPSAPVISQQIVQAISATDGTVTLTPPSNGGQPAKLAVTAVTGDSAALSFTLDQYP